MECPQKALKKKPVGYGCCKHISAKEILKGIRYFLDFMMQKFSHCKILHDAIFVEYVTMRAQFLKPESKQR